MHRSLAQRPRSAVTAAAGAQSRRLPVVAPPAALRSKRSTSTSTSIEALLSTHRLSCSVSSSPASLQQRRPVAARASWGEDDGGGNEQEEKIEFGYTRKDVLLIGAGVFALGYAMYYGLQAAGVDQGMAGNYVQLIIFCALCFGWVGSYLWRVASKNMSYAKQLEAYEEAVMQKRLEEMPEAERARLLAEAEEERRVREGGGSV